MDDVHVEQWREVPGLRVVTFERRLEVASAGPGTLVLDA